MNSNTDPPQDPEIACYITTLSAPPAETVARLVGYLKPKIANQHT